MAEVESREAEYKQTTVERGTRLQGSIESDCQVIVRGSIAGDVSAPTLIITETGSVLGQVKAPVIQAQGTLGGRIEADDVQLSGRVENDTLIRAKTLEVKPSGDSAGLEVSFGECMLDIGDDPSEARERRG